jgi:molecular chaperone DnaK
LSQSIVSVSAKDLETGQQQSITVTATSGLTTDEMAGRTRDRKVRAYSGRERVLRGYLRRAFPRREYEIVAIFKEDVSGTRDETARPVFQEMITAKLVNPQASQGIVVERTAEELRKIMKGAQPEAAVKIMYEIGLLQKC